MLALLSTNDAAGHVPATPPTRPPLDATGGGGAGATAESLSFAAPPPALRADAPALRPATAALKRSGCIRLRGAHDPAVCRAAAEFVTKRLEVLRQAAASAGAGGEEVRLKTRELVRRSPGRCVATEVLWFCCFGCPCIQFYPPPSHGDVRPSLLPRRRYDVTWTGSSEEPPPFAQLRRGAPWLPLMRRLLGPACRLLHSGCVVALPGAETQGVHRDGKALFGEAFSDRNDDDLGEGGGTVQSTALPVHCITVFIPLAQLDDVNGPTEYWPGTHRIASEDVAGRAPLAFGGSEAGDAILFDYRVLHRGGHNASDEPRLLAYFTYGRSWFADATNYSDTSLLPDETSVLPDEAVTGPRVGSGGGGGASPSAPKAEVVGAGGSGGKGGSASEARTPTPAPTQGSDLDMDLEVD